MSVCEAVGQLLINTTIGTCDQLVEAHREQTLSRVLARWSRVELIVIDELGYVPLAEGAAELLFQVVADEPKKQPSSSPPTCPSRRGHRSSPTHGSARPCSTGSPTWPTSSRRARSPTASAEPLGRRRKSKPGCSVLLPLRPPGYAPAAPSTLNINVPKGEPEQTADVGQAKLPKSRVLPVV